MAQIDVLKLAAYFEKSNILKFSYEIDNEKIYFEKEARDSNNFMKISEIDKITIQEKNDNALVENNEFISIKAPMVGVFYTSPSPKDKAYVNVGDRVVKGQTVCLIEAMKMMSEITSPVNGVIKNICLENEAIVSYDEKLIEVLEC